MNENSRAIFLFSKITLDLIKSSFINRLQLKQTNYKLTADVEKSGVLWKFLEKFLKISSIFKA